MTTKRKVALLVLVVVVVFGVMLAGTRFGLEDQPRDLAIRNARVLDARTGTISDGLIVQNGRIVSLEASTGAIDLGGRYVVPGLIDLHSHMLRAGYCSGNEGVAWDNIAQVPFNFDLALRHGHTTLVDLGGPLGGVTAVRDRLAVERALAPRYLVAGPILTAPNGYPLDWADREMAADLQVVLELGDPKAAVEAIDRLATARVDLIKVASMELGYDERPLPTIAPDVFAAVTKRAHERGLRVFVHAHSNAGYVAALDAGADVIAHSTFERLPDDLVTRVATATVVVVPTLWVFAAFERARVEPGLLDELRPQLMPGIFGALSDFHGRFMTSGDDIPPDFQAGLTLSRTTAANAIARENLRRLASAGATIGYGSDSSFCYALHGAAHRELGEMVAAGLSPREAFAAATIGSAKAIGRSDLGVIEVGAAADLLVLDGNPLEDPSVLAKPYAVVSAGRFSTAEPVRPGLLRTLRAAIELLVGIYL